MLNSYQLFKLHLILTSFADRKIIVTIVTSFLGDVIVFHVDAVVMNTDLTSLSNSRFTSFAIADFAVNPYVSDMFKYVTGKFPFRRNYTYD